MNNQWCGHPTFLDYTWDADIYVIDGKKYVVEMYQDGEVCGDDEIWGSMIIDLENMQAINVSTFAVDKDFIIKAINEHEGGWYNMYISDNDADAIKYYTEEDTYIFK